MRNLRHPDPMANVEWLKQKHARLKEQIAHLDNRMGLTSQEQVEMRQLKKERLWTKDALQAAERQV